MLKEGRELIHDIFIMILQGKEKKYCGIHTIKER